MQITLGVAAYGHSFRVAPTAAIVDTDSLALYPAFGTPQPLGSADTPGDTSLDPCGDPNGVSGVFTFAGLIADGFLNANGTAANGILSTFDQCSQTVSNLRWSLPRFSLTMSASHMCTTKPHK